MLYGTIIGAVVAVVALALSPETKGLKFASDVQVNSPTRRGWSKLARARGARNSGRAGERSRAGKSVGRGRRDERRSRQAPR